MRLDLPTLFVVAIFAAAVASFLLILSWFQNRNVRALALWSAAFLAGSVGVGLIAVRGDIPDIWSITIANALIATAYGMIWAGARHFDRRPISLALTFAGAVIWIAACQFDSFFTTPHDRAALMSAIIVVYSLLTAREFWQRRDEGLMSRLPIVIVLLIHAVMVVWRVPLADTLFVPTPSGEIHLGWWTFIILEAVFFSFCLAYLLEGMAREQIVLWYKNVSLTDPLTGVGNRRLFMERGEKILQRIAFDRKASTLLVFDLDRFKSINDGFGHHAGDKALISFCNVTTAALRPTDLFGRLGGEEFAALLPHTPLDGGLVVAERIRANFEAKPLEIGSKRVTITVSIGVAMANDQSQDLASLIMAADRALYRAKADGRNRVECVRDRNVVRIENAKPSPQRAAS